ncbi:hypothetical protein [Carboxylicivirga sp. N1Y90]|uniref:hypothetical protein n=1 Tax=Carboxylicivirga fragile TaxID=3417571 RepID=UPI003D35895F|nr:hypothetical protein [Marinilabiliaceae bacterium N1Y90]
MFLTIIKSWRLIFYIGLFQFLFIFISQKLTAQKHEYIPYIGTGVLQLKNDMIIPMGMKGKTILFGFQYQRGKNDKIRTHYRIEARQSNLYSSWFNNQTLYRFWQAELGGGYRWYVLDKAKTDLSIGFEGLLTGEYIDPSTYNISVAINPSMYGRYDIGIRNFISFNSQIGKIKLANVFSYHLIGFGYYPKPPYYSLDLSDTSNSYYTKPNTVSHLFNIVHLNNRFSVFLKIKKVPFLLSYGIQYQKQNVIHYKQQYIQNTFHLGLIL